MNKTLWPVLGLLLAIASHSHAAPPAAPPEFSQPQSPTKPVPFPISYVDQGKFDPKLKGLLLPEGFNLELVSTEPTIINPVGMTFGPDGTLFVLEWSVDPITGSRWFEFKETFRYKDGSTKQVATMKKFVMDPIKVLKLNPKTGIYDKAETIIADELPSTVVYHDGWLYTASRGTVRRYKQSRPNGPWDLREVIAQGFCGFHHHQVSGLTFGNDGKLYITSGDDDNFAEGSDGSRATVLRTGAVFRCNPDGSQMETYSLGYRNPYRDLAFDDKFNFFHADNDNEDGSKFTGCRLVHVLEGVDYGWRLKIGARCCRPDMVRGAVAGELPGKLPPMLKTGRGSPAGLLIYNDTRLPQQYRGLHYYPDVFRKTIRAYKIAPKDASFEVTHEFELMKTETDALFRPCQMVTGPDGAIYICDWRTDSGGAGRLSGDGLHGRIYKLSWAGTAKDPALPLRSLDSWTQLLKMPDDKLVDQLASPEFSDRLKARDELIRRGVSSRDVVLKRFISGSIDGDARLVAIGVLQAFWQGDVEDLFRLLLRDASPDVRRLAVEAIGQHAKKKDIRTQEAIQRLLSDEHPTVRRAAAMAVSRIGADGAGDMLVNAWTHEQLQDPFLVDGYLRGIEQLGKPGIDAMISLANSGQNKQLERVANAFITFRTLPASQGLLELIQNEHLSAEWRASLIRSFTNYQFETPLSLDPLADYLAKRPQEPMPVKLAAMEVFAAASERATSNKMTSFILAQLDSSDPEMRLAALQVVEEAKLSTALEKLMQLLADPKRQAGERIAVLRALRSTGGTAVVAPLIELLNRQEPANLKLEALRALAATSPSQAKTIAEKLLDQPDPALLSEAVVVLGASKEGAKIVAERFLAKKLPRELFQRVTEVLQKFNTDPALAKLYGEVMKGGLLLSINPNRLQEIQKLVLSKGNAQRGKALYLNTKILACASCHQMEGTGGNVGPDLTRLWDTMTLEKILESIVEPSKEIKEGYQSYKAVTADGRIFSGLRITDSPKEVVIREANGQDVRLLKADLEEMNPSKVSLMPDNVVSQLSFDQFIDLLAFLKNKPAQESLRGSVFEFAIHRGVAPNLEKVEPFEKSVSPNSKLPEGMTWQPTAVDGEGKIALANVGKGKSDAAYALVYVFSPVKQKVKLEVSTESAIRFQLAGKSLINAEAKGQTVQLSPELAQGWTPILVKFIPESSTFKLSVRFEGAGLKTAIKPSEK
jgi:quinoprotein glucose dehydrogenase